LQFKRSIAGSVRASLPDHNGVTAFPVLASAGKTSSHPVVPAQGGEITASPGSGRSNPLNIAMSFPAGSWFNRPPGLWLELAGVRGSEASLGLANRFERNCTGTRVP